MSELTNVGLAQKQREEIKKLESELQEFGVYPVLTSERNQATKFLERIRKNARLAAVCRKVNQNGIIIILCRPVFRISRKIGKVRDGFIFINVSATDQEIIDFLNK